MKRNFRFFVVPISARSRLCTAVAAALLAPLAYGQVRPTHREELPDFDHRTSTNQFAPGEQRSAGKAHLTSLLPSAVVDFDPLLQTPAFVRAMDGFLTGTNGQGRSVSAAVAQALPTDGQQPIKAFLNEHTSLFGFGAEILTGARVTRDYTDAHNGMRTVAWEQRLDGIPVFQSLLKGQITKNGELASVASLFVANPAAAADAGTPNRSALQAAPSITAAQAIVLAAQNLGVSLTAGQVVQAGGPSGDGGYLVFNTPGAAYVRLVWLPMNAGSLRLGWEVMVTVPATGERFRLVIDAADGTPHLRQTLTRYISDATYNVYTSDSPSPFSPGLQTPGNTQPPLTSRVSVTTPAVNVTASPEGWIPDGGNTTTGNNTDTFVDRNFDQQPDQARPVGNPNRVFDFPLDLTLSPSNYIDAATVQMFYWVNWYHDKVYQLGFTEAAGNYQQNNFGRGGLGNDSITAYVQAGADLGIANNAFFAPAPDGFNGQIAMFVWSGPNPDRDGDLDADVILHEATHGTSERLVGAGVLISALQTGGMGEGWSDFYALSLNSQPTDNPDLAYPAAAYAAYLLGGLSQNYYFGLRHYPYCTDMNKNPFTFKDIDPGQILPHTGVPLSPIYPFFPQEASEVHHQGEIWCTTLWEVRAKLIHKYGFAGNQIMLQLVTDGMKLGPANPNFLQARDAILLADQVNNAGANAFEIWSGFAKRGMGFSAESPASTTTSGVKESYDIPGLLVDNVGISGGNGNGAIDFNECNNLNVTLVNHSGFAISGITTRLFTTNQEVIVAQPVSPYADMPDSSTNVNLTAFKVSTSPAFICGTPIHFILQIKSDQITATNAFQLATGTPVPPIRFDSTGPVPIPDATPAGTNSYIVVSNVNSAITKVTLSVFLPHTFDSDLTLELISPDNVTNLLSAHNGGGADNYGLSCAPDSQRTTFDDNANLSIDAGVPPYLGSYKPQAPLSVYAGKSGTNVNGIWTLHVVDDVAIDVGVIQCWSLNLTAAQCTDGGGECPGSELALGVVSQPDPVVLGNPLTYLIALTNNGPSEAKNTTIAHILPGSVIFQSASTSQGGFSHNGGTVTINFGSIPARGRATALVTVLPTVVGVISSSATASSTQSDPDPSNNSVTVLTHVNPPTTELVIGLAAQPEPVVVNGSLTYTVSVTNNGPSDATQVTVTNVLAPSMAILNAGGSQGTVSISSNVVVCSFGTLFSSGRATATINVRPSSQGVFAASSQVGGAQLDPLLGNNSATVSSSVLPAADLALTLAASSSSVVVGSNFTYQINVVNNGPNPASTVALNGTFPASLTVVSNYSSHGALNISGGSLNADLGTFVPGEQAVITLVLNSSSSATFVSSFSVGGAEADPNLPNNTASITTTVDVPKVVIAAFGVNLTSESLSPTNGAVDIGETVGADFYLSNIGNINSPLLSASLLSTNGVLTDPSTNTQALGIFQPGGAPLKAHFTFTASGTNGGTVTAVIKLLQGGNPATNPPVNFVFGLPNVFTFANAGAITIRDLNTALPYPSTLNISGVTGTVGNVALTLSNISHGFSQDIDALVSGPTGQKTILMSGAGSAPLQNIDITFDDRATGAVPDPSGGTIPSGSYHPANHNGVSNLPAPAPAGPYPAAMSVFNGANPNGTWSLFVQDSAAGDTGSIAGGWSVALTIISPVNKLADVALLASTSANPVLAGNNLTYTFTVTNSGPDTASNVRFTDVLPAGLTYVSSSTNVSAVGNTVSGNLGTISRGATATVSITANPGPTLPNPFVNPASVTAFEVDLNPANNTNNVATGLTLPVSDLALTLSPATNVVVTGSNVTYSIIVSNAGPGDALNVVVTNILPVGLSSITVSNPLGSFSVGGGIVTAGIAKLTVSNTATITIKGTASGVATLTNSASVATASQDLISSNNAATTLVSVVAPAPGIVSAGVLLLSESIAPPNGAIDPGETVTVSISLRNVGLASASSVTATLQASGGVTPIAPVQQSYGSLLAGGAASANTFSFTANGVSGGTLVTTLLITNGSTFIGTVTNVFAFPSVATFSNNAAITIPDHGAGSPYPSVITVTNMPGLISKVKVSLSGLTHGFPRDVNALLVSPAGGNVLLMSHAGGPQSVTNAITLTFDDAAGSPIPVAGPLVTSTNQPGRYFAAVSFPAPAPAAPFGATLASLAGKDANGSWKLFVFDDSTGDAGMIGSGWSLQITTLNTINPVADITVGIASTPASLFVGGVYTNIITVSNSGPSATTGLMVTNSFPFGVSVVSTGAPPPGPLVVVVPGSVTLSLGSLAAGTATNLSVVLVPTFGISTITNTVTVGANEADLNLANNIAQSFVSALVATPATLSGSVSNQQFELTVLAEANLRYVIQASTNLSDWVPLSTNTASAAGTIKYIDTTSPAPKSRYYRAVRVLP